ncbi:hypothetical protein HMPREF0972_00869 [Actinomyces sp. oral taxon 848 str. F0332]|nr:hypothetical protein HMPREF0972_00869 [Actinomyces sp. oral taxon 848 str. F0332]
MLRGFPRTSFQLLSHGARRRHLPRDDVARRERNLISRETMSLGARRPYFV